MENNTSLQQQLLEAGVHFGHLRKKWNPKMLPYIFAEKKGIHIIDLNKTTEALQEAAAALKQVAKSGKKNPTTRDFIATVRSIGMPSSG